MKNTAHTTPRFMMAATLAFLAGCTSPQAPEPVPVPPPPRAPEVVAAEQLFEQGKVQDAIIACVDIAKKNPEAVGLTDLQQRITERLAKERMAEAEKRSAATTRLHTADANKFSVSPDTYRQRKHVVGENAPLRTAPTAMQRALALPVTVHLVNADINASLNIGRKAIPEFLGIGDRSVAATPVIVNPLKGWSGKDHPVDDPNLGI